MQGQQPQLPSQFQVRVLTPGHPAHAGSDAAAGHRIAGQRGPARAPAAAERHGPVAGHGAGTGAALDGAAAAGRAAPAAGPARTGHAQPSDLTTGAGLREAISRSGLFLESSLAQGSHRRRRRRLESHPAEAFQPARQLCAPAQRGSRQPLPGRPRPRRHATADAQPRHAGAAASCRAGRRHPRRAGRRGRRRPAARPVARRGARRAGAHRSGPARRQQRARLDRRDSGQEPRWPRRAATAAGIRQRHRRRRAPVDARLRHRPAHPRPGAGRTATARPAPVGAPVGRAPGHHRTARTDLRRPAPSAGGLRPAAGSAQLPDRRAASATAVTAPTCSRRPHEPQLPSPQRRVTLQAEQRRREQPHAGASCRPRP